MNKDQKTTVVAFCLTTFILGFIAGNLFNEWIVNNAGIPETSYCKGIQIDTLQYNYKQNMYKYEVEIIK